MYVLLENYILSCFIYLFYEGGEEKYDEAMLEQAYNRGERKVPRADSIREGRR